MHVGWIAWTVFAVVVLASIAIDLVVHRGDHTTGRKQALVWSGVWIAVAVAFGVFVAVRFGHGPAANYYAAWILEKSLSVDNLFVFLIVFERLKIPNSEQHRVLFWGILGALVMRGAFIVGGTAMLSAWHGTLYVMGAFLVFTGIRTALESSESEKKSRILDFLSKHLPLTKQTRDHRFFVREDGRLRATPLFLALAVIEITDVIFAVDSVPAVLAVTDDPFIAYTSNVFAVLGLRALYLVLAATVAHLRYMRIGLGAILVLVGVKMVVSRFVHIPAVIAIGVIALVLATTVIASVIKRRSKGGPVSAPG